MLIGMIEAAIKMKMALPGNKTVEESENIRPSSLPPIVEEGGSDEGNKDVVPKMESVNIANEATRRVKSVFGTAKRRSKGGAGSS
ncbi:hypothetical protein M9H77_21399 [Catharanthus roseus]|uniref:Uncharacterized protein n=1 Tax=Catharanthus roseus TaxID=4058 RepID=A0ACC0AN88_CATRO|nr:hypothetical protein M9H77_21399 [Catharanthus roseus]